MRTNHSTRTLAASSGTRRPNGCRYLSLLSTAKKQVVNTSLSLLPLGACASLCAPVLTYHACFDDLPPGVMRCDNVSPQRLYDQIATLKRTFTVVPVDEFCEAKRRKGVVAVTFDDGYKSVIENALPVFSALNVPFTVFVTSSSFEQKLLWRHKLTWLVQAGLSSAFEGSLRHVRRLPGKTLLAYSKDPTNHSAALEAELDGYIASNRLAPNVDHYLFDDPRFLVKHPLLWYGNHSHNHYVLSSLSRVEQETEIRTTRAFLARFPHIQVSNVFAAPFGQPCHINRVTVSILEALGYKAVLLNRGGMNPTRIASPPPVEVIERVHIEDGDLGPTMKKEYVRALFRRAIKQ